MVYVPKLAVGLVHYPVLDRTKKTVATNITNFDIHDIARASRVYGAEKYYIIHPLKDQQMFVDRVLDHWRVGEGSQFNPSRKKALTHVSVQESVDAALKDWGQTKCITVATHARPIENVDSWTFKALKEYLHTPGNSVFLLWGTGSGLTEDFLKSCDGVLEPIRGAPPLDFRHLSVRSAASICLDRLMGPW